MNQGKPALIIDTGGPEPRRIELCEDRACTIGRAPDNCVVLSDPAASRQHCRVFFRDGGYWVEDLGSSNGTLLNDDRLDAPRRLEVGDRITAGSSRIRFAAETGSGSLRLSEPDRPLTVHAVDLISLLSSGKMTPVQQAAAVAPSREDEFFRTIDRVGQSLLVHCPLGELYQKIVDLVGESLEAERATLLFPEGDDELLPGAIYVSEGQSGDEILVSRSIAQRVIQDRHAILVADAQHDARFQEQKSVILQRIQSALCVPLWDDHEVIGLLYADKRSPIAPFEEDDLRLLTLIGHLAAVKVRETQAQEELRRRQQIEEELKNAAKIQEQLLPAEPLVGGGCEIAGRNIPCLGVGGDYFDYLTGEDGRITLALGDVSGKGMSAALLMASLHANVHACAGTGCDLPQMSVTLNRAMHRSTQGRRFVTLFLARFDPDSGRLRYVNAGHNYPLLLRAAGEVEELSTGGLMLGAFPEAEYEMKETELSSGDVLLVYSDGVTEAEAGTEEFYEEERLLAFLREHRDLAPEALAEAIIDEIRRFSAPEAPGDDVTVLVLHKT